jgi:hypothetical protein
LPKAMFADAKSPKNANNNVWSSQWDTMQS